MLEKENKYSSQGLMLQVYFSLTDRCLRISQSVVQDTADSHNTPDYINSNRTYSAHVICCQLQCKLYINSQTQMAQSLLELHYNKIWHLSHLFIILQSLLEVPKRYLSTSEHDENKLD